MALARVRLLARPSIPRYQSPGRRSGYQGSRRLDHLGRGAQSIALVPEQILHKFLFQKNCSQNQNNLPRPPLILKHHTHGKNRAHTSDCSILSTGTQRWRAIVGRPRCRVLLLSIKRDLRSSRSATHRGRGRRGDHASLCVQRRHCQRRPPAWPTAKPRIAPRNTRHASTTWRVRRSRIILFLNVRLTPNSRRK